MTNQHWDGSQRQQVLSITKRIKAITGQNFGAYENEGDLKSLMRKIKESKFCDLQNMPYKKCTKLMIVSSLEAKITWMGELPMKNVISKTSSPSAILLWTPEIDATPNTLQPRSYANYNIETRRENNAKIRSVASISLSRSKKCIDHYFMSLNTGRRIHSY